MKNHVFTLVFACLLLAIPAFLQSQTDTTLTKQRSGYDQREFSFLNLYNQLLWKYLSAVDDAKDGHYKSNLTWSNDRNGKITSLLPDVDNSLFTAQSKFRALNSEREALDQAAYDDQTHHLNDFFWQAVQNAQEGVDQILKYYATPWKLQTEAQAGEVQKKGGWTTVWEAMRDIVTKSRDYYSYVQQTDSPKLPYVEANVVTNLLPPVLMVPPTPPGSPLLGFWYNVGDKAITVSEPLVEGTSLMVGDVILGVYKFGDITVSPDA